MAPFTRLGKLAPGLYKHRTITPSHQPINPHSIRPGLRWACWLQSRDKESL